MVQRTVLSRVHAAFSKLVRMLLSLLDSLRSRGVLLEGIQFANA
jgi:hypothetical protein